MTGPEDRTSTLTEASLLLAVLFLGTNPVAVKVAVAEFPPLPFVAVRFTVAGLLLLGLVALLETGGRPGGRDLLSMAGVGLLGVGANNVAFTLGVGMTTASTTALLYAAVPVWGILLGLALGLERPTLGGLAGRQEVANRGSFVPSWRPSESRFGVRFAFPNSFGRGVPRTSPVGFSEVREVHLCLRIA